MNLTQDILTKLKGDKVIWLIVILLGLTSILSVYSAAGSMAFKNRGGNTEYYLIQQLLFIGVGFFVVFVTSSLHYMWYSKIAPWLILLTVPLLLYTMTMGTAINEAARWINIPWIDKTIQTSDFARIALIIFIAKSISKKQEFIKDFQSAFVPIIFPIILICSLIAPADLSTAILLFSTSIMMMFIGRVSMKYILVLLLMGIAAFAFILFIGQQFPELVRVDTWTTRINDFVSPEGSYQMDHSKAAIANGGIFGVGPGNSFQRNYLPYAYADFIYSIICEEYGLIGGFAILGIYLWLLFRCIGIVTRCPKTFGAILAIGLCLNIVIQAFTNIAVSVHLVPVTGLTLPLVSMGGTSVLFTCISFGIILSVSRFIEEARTEEKQELKVPEFRNAFGI